MTAILKSGFNPICTHTSMVPTCAYICMSEMYILYVHGNIVENIHIPQS